MGRSAREGQTIGGQAFARPGGIKKGLPPKPLEKYVREPIFGFADGKFDNDTFWKSTWSTLEEVRQGKVKCENGGQEEWIVRHEEALRRKARKEENDEKEMRKTVAESKTQTSESGVIPRKRPPARPRFKSPVTIRPKRAGTSSTPSQASSGLPLSSAQGPRTICAIRGEES
jgi:hypothetical protein